MFCIVRPNIFLPWAYPALNFWVRHWFHVSIVWSICIWSMSCWLGWSIVHSYVIWFGIKESVSTDCNWLALFHEVIGVIRKSSSQNEDINDYLPAFGFGAWRGLALEDLFALILTLCPSRSVIFGLLSKLLTPWMNPGLVIVHSIDSVVSHIPRIGSPSFYIQIKEGKLLGTTDINQEHASESLASVSWWVSEFRVQLLGFAQYFITWDAWLVYWLYLYLSNYSKYFYLYSRWRSWFLICV